MKALEAQDGILLVLSLYLHILQWSENSQVTNEKNGNMTLQKALFPVHFTLQVLGKQAVSH